MKMSKVGNQTNSQDPQAVNSRVFVGNLNTFQCSKTDVERMFQRYGRLAGISMHKGYAFVQFTNPFDARSACLGEDGRTVLSQVLDVNMVAEPKPHQTGRKRQNVAKTGNDWDYYYDSYYASTAGFPVGPPPRLVPPLKRPRLMALPGRPAKVAATTAGKNATNAATVTAATNLIATSQSQQVSQQSQIQQSQPPQQSSQIQISSIDQLKTYSNPDILICGNCREMFTELKELIEHKKTYCKLRFTCKCHSFGSNPPGDEIGLTSSTMDSATAVSLLCVQCKDSFANAWDLMVHAQAAHMVNIYELGLPKFDSDKAESNGEGSFEANSPRESTPEKENGSAVGSEYDENGLMLGSPENDDTPHNNHNHLHLHHHHHHNNSHQDEEEGGSEKELAELLDVQSTAQACIMHALSLGNMSEESCPQRTGNNFSGESQPPALVVSLANGKQ